MALWPLEVGDLAVQFTEPFKLTLTLTLTLSLSLSL